MIVLVLSGGGAFCGEEGQALCIAGWHMQGPPCGDPEALSQLLSHGNGHGPIPPPRLYQHGDTLKRPSF